MLLSIAMIIKNEEKHLHRTLSALKPLMNEVDSELIIVDTGSTDNSVNIARQYTDKVYFKEWTGNFAEMRNESFKYAKGEWILVLDADEELIDYEVFIEIFKNGELKKYNSLNVSLINFSDEQLTKYTRIPLLRVFRNEDGFKYTGSIHEQPVFKKPIFNSPNGVFEFNHYGYIFEDEKIRQQKIKRNEENLLKELEKNPNNPYMNYQLGQNYLVANNLPDAISCLEKSMRAYDKANLLYIPCFVKLISCYNVLNKYLEIEDLCLKYLKKDSKNIDIYYYLANAQMNMCKYDKSLNNFKKYLYYMENYEITTQANDYTCPFESEKYKLKAMVNYCELLIRFKRHKESYELIEGAVEEYKDDIDSLTTLHKLIVKLCIESNEINKLLKFYDIFSTKERVRTSFRYEIENALLKESESIKFSLYKELSKINDNYGVLNKYRVDESNETSQILDILLSENSDYYGELIKYLFNESFDIAILKDLPAVKVKKYFSYLFMMDGQTAIDAYNYIKNNKVVLNMEDLRICAIIESELLNKRSLSLNQKKYIFDRYKVDKYRLLKNHYNSELSDIDILKNLENITDILIMRLTIAKNNINQNKMSVINCIKELIMEYPLFKDILDMELQNEIKNVENIIKETNDIKHLKLEFKRIIENNINAGNINNAKALIDEYTSINDMDEEILNMKSIVELSSGDIIESLNTLEESYSVNSYNYNTIYNLAYIYGYLNEFEKMMDCYNCILRESNDLSLINQVKEDLKG